LYKFYDILDLELHVCSINVGTGSLLMMNGAIMVVIVW